MNAILTTCLYVWFIQTCETSFVLVNATDVRFGYYTGTWKYNSDFDKWSGLARLDSFGRVYAHPVNDYWSPNSISNPCMPLVKTTGEKTVVCKYIAGRVIPGQLENMIGQHTKFVPKPGAKVMSIHQYLTSENYYPNHSVPRLENDDYQPPERMVVYNLPAYTMRFKHALQHAFQFRFRQIPFPSEVHTAECMPHTQRDTNIKYRFVPDDNKCKYIARIGATFYQGTLEGGEFFPDFSAKVSDDKAKNFPIYRKPLVPNEQVYEFYSDALIPGYLYKIPKGEILLFPDSLSLTPETVRAADDDYVFVPITGATVISLQQYLDEYVPGKSKRIHNLPGTIEEKK